jgi:hypothetical protein
MISVKRRQEMAIDGTYNLELDTPMGKRTSKLTLKTDGKSLSGTHSDEMGEQSFTDGSVSGDDFTFSTKVSSPMGEFQLGFKGTVSGDSVTGEVQAGEFGSFPFKGTRA